MRDDQYLAELLHAEALRFMRRHGGRMSNLDYLTPDMKRMALAHEAACKEAGFALLIYCTVRHNSEQDRLYAQGRTTPGKIVTNARAGQSPHNPDKEGRVHAYDCVPLRNGKPVWEYSSKEDAAIWARLGALAEEVGLVWSGRWTGKLKEMCHCQDPTWVKPV